MASVPSRALTNGRLRRLFPFLNWIGELRDGKILRADLIAGITVALVLVPQSMAYAQLAGLPAYYGLYAAFLPPMVAALFGSSRQLATGPVAVVSLLTAAALEPIAASGSPGYVAYAITLSLIVGLFQLGLGLLRLGVVVNFLSHPVIIGFTNAAAIIIATSQLDKIFGVRAEKAEHHYETVWNTIVAVTHADPLADVLHCRGRVRHHDRAAALQSAHPERAHRRGDHHHPFLAHPLRAPGDRDARPDREQGRAGSGARRDRAQARDSGTRQGDCRRRKEIPGARINAFGTDDSRTLLAQHCFDTLKLKRERRIKTVKADIEEIKKNRFDHVAGARWRNPASSICAATCRKAPTSDGRLWRIRSVDGEKLVMNGGGNVVANVPKGLPSLALPKFDLGVMLQLLSAANHHLAARLHGGDLDRQGHGHPDPPETRRQPGTGRPGHRQYRRQPVAQSYPTSGSFSRSAVNISAGAITGFSSVVTSVIVVVTLLWLTPLLYHLPQATLAAVIMMAVVGLINVKAIKHAWQANKQDGIVAVVSFVLTLAFAPHLDKGILIGAGLALILYLYRTMQPRVAVLARHAGRHAARCRDVRPEDLREHFRHPFRRLAVLRQHQLLRRQGAGTRRRPNPT